MRLPLGKLLERFCKAAIDLCVLAVLMIAPPSILHADTQQALYGDALPRDAVFIRFLGFPEDLAEVTVFGEAFPLAPSDQDDLRDSYVVRRAAELETAQANRFYTVLPDAQDAPLVVEEPARDDTGKVLVSLYNIGTQPAVSLGLADGSAEVITPVAPGLAGHRAVNPVTVPLAVFVQGDAAPIASYQVSLQRGRDLSFLVGADGAVRQVISGIDHDAFR